MAPTLRRERFLFGCGLLVSKSLRVRRGGRVGLSMTSLALRTGEAGFDDLATEWLQVLWYDFRGISIPSDCQLLDGENIVDCVFRQLVAGGDTIVLLAGQEPTGIAVLRLRGAIWSAALECYLAELYVMPKARRRGVGRALMQAAIREARERGAETMDIGVDEPDVAARRLYESMGFTNRAGGPDGPLMYVYERELRAARQESTDASGLG